MISRREDIIYARKYGTALTMDVFTPSQNANGIGLVFAVSGGWFSSHEAIEIHAPRFLEPLANRGYTVFAVVPGSQPKYAIPEIVEDMHAGVRFIRHHARDYKIDPNQLGIYGGSAGGHLSLMIGLTGRDENPDAENTLEREPSRVQCVAEFYAPTDFFNYGEVGANALGYGILADYKAPFDFHEFDEATKTFIPISDAARYAEMARQVSPITHVRAGAPPILAIHGDADELVPLQQSQLLIEKMKSVGAPCRLVVVPGAAHGWEDMSREVELIADWFDEYLLGS